MFHDHCDFVISVDLASITTLCDIDAGLCHGRLLNENLVDPASSHMLVSKIKPCMCVYTLQYNKTANCSLTQLLIMLLWHITLISLVIL